MDFQEIPSAQAWVSAFPSGCQEQPKALASVLAWAGVGALPSDCQGPPTVPASVLAWAGVEALPSDCRELPTVPGLALAQARVGARTTERTTARDLKFCGSDGMHGRHRGKD